MSDTNTIFDKIDNTLDKIMHGVEKASSAFFDLFENSANNVSDINNKIMDLAESIYNKNSRALRIATLPWGYGIPLIYKLLHRNIENKIPLLREGVHMVRSRIGGGKSLTSLVLAELVLKKYGTASYFTSPVEKPQLSKDKKYYYIMHRVINPDNYYKKGKKVLNYNGKKYPMFHKDENHLRFNPRLNKTREYNEKYIPEHQDEILMRHDGFKQVIKYSQHMKLDSQDMEILTYMHEVETIKDIPLNRWVMDGSLKYIPVKLKFHTYIIETDFEGKMKRKLYKKWSMKVPYHVLMKFDTHAESNKNAGLPVDYK